MGIVKNGDDVLEYGCDMVDVTSAHRPDTSWRVVDRAGHVHQWFANGEPAKGYSPEATHDVPTLRWVIDGIGHDEDGSPYDIGHNECVQCGEHIEPRYTADTVMQFAPGPRWFKLNGEYVTQEQAEDYVRKHTQVSHVTAHLANTPSD